MKKNWGPQKIVVTGGPSAGKTTLTEILKREFRSIVEVVPESATILFSGGLPRGEEIQDRTFQQKVIYQLQVEIERYFAATMKNRILVCDRGTLDGLAYWPKNKSSFWKELNTTEATEIRRYDWVIHLDTTMPESYASTSVRKESWADAKKINQRILKAWGNHPQRIIIPNSRDFSVKLKDAIELIRLIRAGASCDEIHKKFKQGC
jgi:predicted ATPase